MRKKFTIEVVLDTNLDDCGLMVMKRKNYTIFINPNACKAEKFRIKNILAHELGHVVAIETKFKAAKEFKKNGWTKTLLKYLSDPTFRLLIEEQAWDIARFMADRNKGLKLHREEW